MGAKERLYGKMSGLQSYMDKRAPMPIHRVNRMFNKALSRILTSEYTSDLYYCFEQIETKGEEISLKGWIADIKHPQTKFKIIICGKNDVEIQELSLKTREDVAKVFTDITWDCGFDFKFSIKTGENVKIYISNCSPYFWNECHLPLTTITPNTQIRGFISTLGGNTGKNNYSDFRNKYLEKKEMGTKTRPVDIVIPVYNGKQFFERLFGTIDRTEVPHRIFIIDDCSPDSEVYPLLEKYANGKNHVTLLKNEVNLGFVGTVNKGLSMTKHDVIIVNTDTEMPYGWIERLMRPIFDNDSIASTTPFTNSGTICSFPTWLENNDIFGNMTVDQVDEEFSKITPTYTVVPTGVGFCMGMSRKAIDAVGVLDQETFGKGYGEENDWCRRCCNKGFTNVHVENLFVYHKHGGSFTSEEKQRYIESNLAKLNALHPEYPLLVNQYIMRNPLESLRNYIILKLAAKCSGETILYFDHGWGGGATKYVDERIKENQLKNNLTLRLIPHKTDFMLSVHYSEFSSSWNINSTEELEEILQDSKIDKIIISEIIAFKEVTEGMKLAEKLKKINDSEMIFLVHDFYSVCPSFYLLDLSNCYCHPEKSQNKCFNCLKRNQNAQNCNISPSDWRMNWENFLNKCTKIIAFSESSKDILSEVYEIKTPIEIIPHTVNNVRKVNTALKSDQINICVLGNYMKQKGTGIVKQMAELTKTKKLPIKIYHFGSTFMNKINNVEEIGPYEPSDLPDLMEKYNINLVLIPSIWPETFSYTTEEGIQMGLPVAAFDLGAPAERLKKYEKGIVIEEIDATKSLEEILRYFGMN